MSRHRRRAIVLSVLATVLAIAGLAMLGRGSATPRHAVMATQVVLLHPVPVGGRLTADVLGLIRMPARYASSGRVAGPREAVGRRAAVALAAGALLMQAELASDDGRTGGRDVAVRVDDAAGLPAGDLAGAHADVFLALPTRGVAPRVVLSNVLVVAAGRSDGAAVATLRLPRAAVGALIAAEGRGSLRLVVRAAPGTP